MSNKEKLALLEEMLELEEGELSEEVLLDNLDSWDSMAALSLIALLDKKFERTITFIQIKNFITIGDILNFMA